MAGMFGTRKPAPAASPVKPAATPAASSTGASNKKLADFYNVKASASKRFKVVLKFVEAAEKSPHEITDFFDKDHETIFTERWNKAETQDKIKKKEKDFQGTLMNIILMMKHFMVYSPGLIAKKWKYTEFAKVIDRHLSKGCKAAVRLAAFEVLLLFISNIKTGIDEQLFLFQNTINLNPFQGRSGIEGTQLGQLTLLIFRILCIYAQRNADQSCLIPSNAEPTIDDGVALWEMLLQYISHKDGEFDYWFELIKARYFVVFFPQICQELGLKVDHSRGFTTCPHPLLRSLINQIAVWAENPAICQVLWAPKNGLLMMEFLRQSAMMGVKDYHATIKRSCDCFRLFLMNPLLTNKLIGEQNPILQTYWRLFIRGIAEIFLLQSSEPELPVHMALCKDVLSSYTIFSLDYAKKMQKPTWDVLQMTLLEFTHTMFKRGNPLAENLTNQVADEMMNKLLFIWIASQTTTEDMWLAFKDKIGQLLEWKATVSQWKEKMVQLTHVLNDFFYRIPMKEEAPNPNTSTERSQTLMSKTSPINIRETKVTVLQWDEESIKTTWFGTLHILGNINRITEPNNYATGMSCMHDMIEILLKSEERLPPTEQPPIPLYQIFLPWLLEGCAVDDKRSKGKILAYTILCKMFCRQHPFKMDVKFLSHFYRVIQLALSVGNPNLIWVIMQHGYMLFHLPLPGVSVLIPDFLREIDQMFRAENKVSVPETVQMRALTILISLICYPSHFGGLDSMNFTEMELRARMSVTLNIANQYKQLSMPKNKVITIWGLCLLVFEEATTSARKEILGECLRTLTLDTVHPNEEVARNACDALCTIALIGEILEKIDPNMVLEVLSSLCDDVVNLIEKGVAEGPPNMREACITNHWNAILDLLMLTQTMAGVAPLMEKVFRTVEIGLLGELVTEDITEGPPPAPAAAPPAATGPTPGGGESKLSPTSFIPLVNRKGTNQKTGGAASKAAAGARPGDLFTAYKNAPSHKSAIVRESTEIFLVNLLAHHNNFPSLAGPQQLVSRRGFDARAQTAGTDETDLEEEARTLYFVYHGQHIITICQLKDNTVRVTFRDCVGKYTWDAKLQYESTKIMTKAIDQRRQAIQKARAAKPEPKSRVVEYQPPPFVPPPRRAEDVLPMYQAGDPVSQAADSLSDLVAYHKRHYPSQIGKDFVALDVNPALDKEIADLVATLTFQSEDERLALDAGRNNRVPLPLNPPTPNSHNASHFHHARLFLSHMGLLSPEARQFLHVIDTGPKFRRHLRELDKINGRDIVKIGLIYVREGQEDQKEILRNVQRSKIYSQFVKGLGWNVTVRSHTGYIGGIERDGPAGSTAPYFASHSYEMMFHDITRMPNIETDEKCVNKKKHVGNDAVHVVWSESRQEYKAATITSQFNDVHIVVYPMFNGLFRCQVLQKEKLGSFGPIIDGMVLSKRLLPTLVRQTAFLANRAVRSIKEGFVRPNVTRQRLIKDVHDKYKVEKPVEEFLATLYPLVPISRDELLKAGAGVGAHGGASGAETETKGE